MPLNPACSSLILCLLLMVPWRLPAAAVDLTLALDRSLSMNANDPNRDSLKGAELFAEMMSDASRLSLTTFAQDGQSLLPLTPLSDRAALDRILGLIHQVRMDGTRTDFAAALRLGYLELTQRGQDPDRDKILVLFSDGQLNLGTEEATQSARVAIINELIPQFQAAGIRIYGIAFSPEADLDFLRLLTDSTGGRAFRAERSEDIYLAFLKLFEQADLPLTAAVIDGAVEVDPDVRELKLLVQRDANDAPTRLTDPSQRELVAGDQRPGVDWRSTGTFDHITIQQPQAGSWKITADGQEKRAYLESDLDLEVKLPALANVDEAIGLSARLTDRGRDVAPELASQTRFTATLIDESGAVQQRLQLLPEDDATGSRRHRGILRLATPGAFQVRVSADGDGFQRVKLYSLSILPPGTGLAQTKGPEASDVAKRRSAILALVSANLALMALLGIGMSLWWWRRRGRTAGDDFADDA